MDKKVHVNAHDRNPPKKKAETASVITCAHCSGTGDDVWGICPVCKGKGKVRV